MVCKRPKFGPCVIKNISEIVVVVTGVLEIESYQNGETGDKKAIMLMKPIGNAHKIEEIMEIGALFEAPIVSSATKAAES